MKRSDLATISLLPMWLSWAAIFVAHVAQVDTTAFFVASMIITAIGGYFVLDYYDRGDSRP